MNEMHQAKINGLARQAMRWWWPRQGLLSLRGVMEWERWALAQACAGVREGWINGEFVRQNDVNGWKLDRQPPAPIIPDEMFEAWRANGQTSS